MFFLDVDPSRLPVNQPVDNFMATLCADGDIKAFRVEFSMGFEGPRSLL